MTDYFKFNKLLIKNNKFNIFIRNFELEGYLIINFKKEIYKFIDNFCEIICTDVRTNIMNEYQISEIISLLERYFGKYCIETYIIVKNIDKKILIYNLLTEENYNFFLNKGFVELR